MQTNNFQYFPPVKQQGATKWCQANALAAIAETFRTRAGIANESLSRMFLISRGKMREGLPLHDMNTPPSMESLIAVAEQDGIPAESLHGYDDGGNTYAPAPHVVAEAARSKLTGHYSIPIDPYNYTATAYAVRAALEQGHLVGMSFKQRVWFAYLGGPEEFHIARGASVVPGSEEHRHLENHYVCIADFYDSFMGTQGLAFVVRNSKGDSGLERSCQIIAPTFFRDAINIEAFTGFAGCNDRHTYDADGIPGQVYRLYRAAFDRLPDKQGMGYHIDNMERGVTLAQVASQFIASPEFQSKYGALGNRAFVELLYRNVLHRPGDAGGIDFHTANLDAGRTARHDTLVSFSASPEYYAKTVAVFEAGVAYT